MLQQTFTQYIQDDDDEDEKIKLKDIQIVFYWYESLYRYKSDALLCGGCFLAISNFWLSSILQDDPSVIVVNSCVEHVLRWLEFWFGSYLVEVGVQLPRFVWVSVSCPHFQGLLNGSVYVFCFFVGWCIHKCVVVVWWKEKCGKYMVTILLEVYWLTPILCG